MAFLDLLDGDAVTLVRRARVPAAVLAEPLPATDGLVAVDVAIEAGRIARIAPAAPGTGGPSAGAPGPAGRTVDLDHGILLPAFADVHTHLDKGHIWPRTPNPNGTFAAALAATGEDRARHWTARDVARRMDFSLRAAFAHGTRRIRTHIDSIPPQERISWPVLAETRAAWQGRIEIEAVSLVGIEGLPEGSALSEYADFIRAHGGIVGAVLYPVDGLPEKLARLFDVAERLGLPLDFHVDENGDPASRCLDLVATMALERGFPAGRILCGHCCSLAVQGEKAALATLDKVARAGIDIVSLPMCNLYLQDRRTGGTPRWRGITLLAEMAARGIRAMVASDNTRDPFHAYGDLDMLEVFREAVRIGHLDHPLGDWPAAVTTTPAAVMGADTRIAPGAAADLVAVPARSWTELFARPQADRIVIRDGRVAAARLPDYRELDDLFAATP